MTGLGSDSSLRMEIAPVAAGEAAAPASGPAIGHGLHGHSVTDQTSFKETKKFNIKRKRFWKYYQKKKWPKKKCHCNLLLF